VASGPSILVKFLADTKDLASGVSKVEGAGGKIKGFAKVVGGAFAVGGAIAFGKSVVSAAEESAQATSRLEQVFASMGDTTGTAAKEAENYANAMSKKTGIDDEAIMAAQAQLATFGAVSDQTARTAGVFDRATAAAGDLAAAGFGTLDSNAVQLGKALQDPTHGLTALARSGVTFTDAQKAQIKAMQKSGDLLGAQKVVLGAVEKQVGGTAQATATSSDKMQVAFGNVQEEIGGHLLPVMGVLADLMQRYGDLIIPIGAALIGLVVAMKAYTLATELAGAAQKIWNGIQIAFNVIMSANPIVLVVIAIVALIAAVVLAYKKVDWFRAAVDAMGRAAVVAFNWILDAGRSVFNWVRTNWPLLLAILAGPIGVAVLLITRNWDTIKHAATAAFDAIKGAATAAWRGVSAAFGWIADAGQAAWRFVHDRFEELIGFFRGIPGRIASALGSLGDLISAPFRAAFRGIASLWNNTVGRLSFTVPGWVPGLGGKGFDVPDIPTMARGGITTSAGLAFLHPAEVIAPLSRAGAAVGNTYQIAVSVPPTTSPSTVGRAIVDAIRSYETVAGTSWRMAPTGRAQ
jgi:hypothetical protein